MPLHTDNLIWWLVSCKWNNESEQKDLNCFNFIMNNLMVTNCIQSIQQSFIVQSNNTICYTSLHMEREKLFIFYPHYVGFKSWEIYFLLFVHKMPTQNVL